MSNSVYRLPYGGFVPDEIPPMDSTSHVDATGYVPTEKRITNIMQAGAAITAVTGNQFDYQEIPDNWDVDPTRSGNYDMVDAQRDLARSEVAHNRLRQLRIDQEAQKKVSEGKSTSDPVKIPPE